MICTRNRVAIGLVSALVFSHILIYVNVISEDEQEQKQQGRTTNAIKSITTTSTSSNTAAQPHPQETNNIIIDTHINNASSSTYLNEQCLRNRGTNGFWYRDEDLARKTFFRYGFRSNKWARQTNNSKMDVYPGNSYNWKDTSLGEQCQIHPVTLTSFCNIMQTLDIQRLFFVGDSLAIEQLKSLLGLLGLRPEHYIKNSKKAVIKETSIHCPHRSIGIEIYRQNLGPNFGKTDLTGRTDATRQHRQQFGPEIPYCLDRSTIEPMTNGDYCPWHLRYNETHHLRTLLILNQGAHFHSMETFANSFDQFVTLFNSIAHPGDFVVFRNTVPGHFDCVNATNNISPLNMTHEIFLERYGTTMYDWNLFDAFNRYAKQTMIERLTSKVTSHYLNVYNMTVLRPDEHVSGTDCLHYMHPGPMDYWNHLLFTNLEDLSENMNGSK